MTGLSGFLVLVLLAGGVPAHVHAQQEGQGSAREEPATNGEHGPGLDPDALPVDVERIQRALSRPPAIRPESSRAVIRVEVLSRKLTIDDILGPDWRKGPTPLGVMTHQEFLNVVTPKDVQGYAAFDNKQALAVAATSFALRWALQQAVRKLDDAKTERQKEAAKREVDEALAALRKARRDAGLPER